MDYILYHHGVKGMKWGVRRYQNKDGSLTAAGKKEARKKAKEARKQERERINTKNAAERILGEKIYDTNHDIKRNERKRANSSHKLDKYLSRADRADNKGKLDKRDRYLDKYFNTVDKLEADTIRYDELVSKRDFYKKKLSEIKDGTLEAGRDYVAHYMEAYDGTYYVKDAKLEFVSEKGRS